MWIFKINGVEKLSNSQKGAISDLLFTSSFICLRFWTFSDPFFELSVRILFGFHSFLSWSVFLSLLSNFITNLLFFWFSDIILKNTLLNISDILLSCSISFHSVQLGFFISFWDIHCCHFPFPSHRQDFDLAGLTTSLSYFSWGALGNGFRISGVTI